MLAAAWCGAAAFLLSLTYFLYFYLVRLGQPADVPADTVPRAVVINLLLFSGFAVHHSVFARAGAKAWIARLLPAGFERSFYVWLASLLFLAVCLWWQPLPGIAWRADGVPRWLLHGLQLAGVALSLTSASRIDIWDLAGVLQARTAQSPNPSAPPAQTSPSAQSAQSPLTASAKSAKSADDLSAESADRSSVQSDLEVSGPYRYLRHPIYLGWVLIVFGAPTMTWGRLLFAAISTAYLIVAIPFEERSLGREFGPAYQAYQRQVRWRLVPGLW